MMLAQLPPSADDLAREAAAVASVVANPPTEWLGRTRGSKTADGWAADCAFWQAYPDEPAKIEKGNAAAVAAYMRMMVGVQEARAAATPENPNFDPSGVTWPLRTPPKNATAGGSFGAKRPWNGAQTRWHTGTDLGAPLGSPVLAPEAGTIVAPNSGWESTKDGKGVKALILVSDSGRTWLLGGIRPGSAVVKAGERVSAGQRVAEVGAYPGGGTMVHVSVYGRPMTEKEVTAQKSWKVNGPKPPDLIDSGPLLQAAALNTPLAFVPTTEADDDPAAEQAEGSAEPADAAPAASDAGAPWGVLGVVAGVTVVGGLAVYLTTRKKPRRRRAA